MHEQRVAEHVRRSEKKGGGGGRVFGRGCMSLHKYLAKRRGGGAWCSQRLFHPRGFAEHGCAALHACPTLPQHQGMHPESVVMCMRRLPVPECMQKHCGA